MVIYSSAGIAKQSGSVTGNGLEDSVNIGGWLDVWDVATFHNGADMQGTQINKLAAGTADTDAVNVSQLKGVTTALGGGAAVNADGTIKAPTYTVNGNAYNTVGDAINNISNGGGIKYFHSNSTLSDSTAGGTDSTAIGPEASVNAAAGGGIAIGRAASVTANATSAGVAVGTGAKADADGAMAFGRDAKASVSSSVAIGHAAVADRASGAGGSTKGAVSVGSGGDGVATDTRQIISVARGTQDTDAVNLSQLKGVTTALGGDAAVNADGTVKAPSYTVNGSTYNNVGDAITAAAASGTAKYFHANSTAADSKATGVNSVAVGPNAVAGVDNSIAIGNGAKVDSTNTDNAGVAVGSGAHANGVSNAFGYNANASGTWSTATGVYSAASGANSTALGDQANASAATGVALGSKSVADRASGTGGSTKGAVSVGSGGTGVATDTRQIISVARGKQDTDAVNLSQLKSVVTDLGGGAAVNADGTVKAPTYTIQGTTANDVGTALTKLDTATTKNSGDITTLNTTVNNITNGGGIKYFHTNSTLADSTAGGTDSTAIGPAASVNAAAGGGIAIGHSAAITSSATTGGVAIGSGSKSDANDALAFGRDSSASAADGVALGHAAKADRASGTGGSTKGAVSVGSGGAGVATDTRQIISVARGTQDTDAVNLSQLKSVVTDLGGGAAVNADGTIKAPTYDVNGTNYTNAGSAIDALDTRIDGVTANPLKFSGNSGTDVSRKLGDTLAIKGLATTAGTFSGNNIKTVTDPTNGGISIQMADAPKFGNITVNDSGKISGLSDGTAATDAVTKGQLDAAVIQAGAGWKIKANAGTAGTIKGGDTLAVVDGTNTKVAFDSTKNELKVSVADAPTFSGTVTANGGLTVGASQTVDMGGNKITKVAAGTGDTDAVNISQLKGITTAMGGGAAVNTDGTIKAPTYDVNGTNYSNVGGAVDALDTRIDGVNSTVTNITNGAGIKYFHTNSTLADSTAGGADSTAIGPAASVNAAAGSGIAIGHNAAVTSSATTGGIAVGSGSKADANDALAFGRDSSASAADGVALGHAAKADRASGTGGSTKGAVSVGSGGAGVATDTRQIISVARGTQDTDAVNLSQLKSVVTDLGGGAAVNADGTIKAPSYDVNGTNYTNAGSAIDALDTRIDGVTANPLKFSDTAGTTVSRKLGETLKITGVGTTAGTFSGNNIKTVADATTGEIKIQVADAPKFGNIAVNDSGKISGVAAGTAATDVVNKGQLDAAVIQAGAGWKIKANAGTEGTIKGGDTLAVVDGTNTKVAFDSTKNELKVSVADAPTFSGMVTANGGLTVGAGKTIDMGGNKITKVAAGTADTDAVNVSQLKGITTAMGGGAAVASDGTITQPTYTVDGKDAKGVDGAITALDDSIKSAKDGIDGLNADMADVVKYDSADHKKVTFGEAGTPVVLDNVANGTVAKDSKQAINGGQLFDVQTALTDKGLVFSANSGTNVTRKLGETLGIKGGATPVAGTFSDKNVQTATDTTNGGIVIKMADSPQFGNIVINKGGNGSIDMGGGKITNLTDGTAATDAVTKKQLDDAVISAGAGWKIKANTGTAGTIKGGDTLAVVDGTNTKVAFDSTKNELKVSVVDSPKFGDITINDAGKITGLENGTAAGDAATAGQLQELADVIGGGTKVDPTTGEIVKPSFDMADGTKADTVADAIDNLDTRAKEAKDGIDGINGKIETITGDMADVVKYDSAAHDKVTLGADGTPVVLTNVADGKVEAGSKDAVNGGQLHDVSQSVADAIGGGASVDPTTGELTKPEFKLEDGETTVDNVGDAITNIDSRTTANTDIINNIINNGAGIKYFHTNSTLADSQAKGVDSVAIGGNAIANAKNSVALGSNSTSDRENTVSVGKAGAERQVVNVKAGVEQTDAVNVSQLKGIADAIGGGTAIDPTTGAITPPKFDVTDKDGNTVEAGTVADAISTVDEHVTNVDNRVTNIEGDVTNIIDGKAGLVQQDETSREITVGKDTDGTVVNFTNKDGEARVLDGVANGEIKEGGTQAINGGQAYDIANSVTEALGGGSVVNPDGTISKPQYDVTNADGTTEKVDGVEGAITNLDQRTYDNTTNITNLTQQITNGEVGLVQYDDATGTVTVAAGKGGTTVDFANADGAARQLKNVAAGAEDTDAVNVKQLKDILGGTDTQDENGNYVGPTYNVTNVDGTTTEVHTVGDAITNLDGRVYNLYQNIEQGTVGLVQQAAAGEKLTVGKDTDGAEVNFAGTAGDRKLTGVDNGTVSDKSHDAVNGSQLYTVAQSVADAMGGGSTVNEDGSVTTPVYNVTNVDGTTTTVNGVEGAVTNLDQRTYSNTTQIQNITNQINGSGIGMVQQAAPGADLTVGKGTDGKAVNFTGTDGDRVLTGVAAGSADNDAVNIKQLKDAGVINKDGSANAVVTYDNAEKTSITMGGEGASTPVAIHNVADGVADHDAVNISQLNQRLQSNNTEVLNQANSYTDQRINDVWQDLGDEINQVNRQANRGIAAASALVNVTPYLPGKTAVNAGVASYRGEAALGVGVSRWSDNGRVNFNAGVSAAKGDEPVFRVGVGYVF
ncbi:YadA-like family protein [Lysobacter soli]|uniref:YadA-like family protein n=1 Tax=Lysobacter soli TaxID=453783 RepID=UPI001E5656B8|nr:YadA-like family protein [Lysobacter soli]